ncbi:MAG: YggS family pyridoxal phosphate-dependent enzyme [Alphaproteobacteria bacterium]|nr:YggS family pyridoxal phosphate-dependent enzyme [Alphaproteobacteria bacterium]
MSGTDVAANLRDVDGRIAEAVRAADRRSDSVALVAVAKKQPLDRIEAALKAGHRIFGENRVQEAASKWPAFRERYADIQLHLVGPLQTNKVRDAVALFDVIETLDRPKLIKALSTEMERSGRRPNCFVQVNTGREPQKAGVAPEDADALVAAAREDYRLPVVGLMCIPPLDEEPALHFALLAKLAKRMELPLLSMGMSADFETAIRFGATHVRVGTAIFGPRPG